VNELPALVLLRTVMVPYNMQALAQLASSAGNFVYNFQTLLTGILAVGAAWYAGAPVWRQLKDSNLQTQIMRRDTLAMRVTEAEERAKRVAQSIDGHLNDAQRATLEPWGNPKDLGPHAAFDLELRLSDCLDWYLVTLQGTESAAVEAAKAALKTSLDDLTTTLCNIHWPDHNDQSGEDYALTDEQWGEALRLSAEGEKSASGKVASVAKAYRDLKSAQQSDVDGLRTKIAQLDQSIARIDGEDRVRLR
jgi:hypothetical protein